MAFKPHSIIFFVVLFAVSSIISNPDPAHVYTSHGWKMSASTLSVGSGLQRAMVIDADDVPTLTAGARAALIKSKRAEQVSQSLDDQIKIVDVVPQNSVITIAPLHLKGISFDELPTPQKMVAVNLAPLGNLSKTLTPTQEKPSLTERLCAGPEIVWDKGEMGMAAFVARGDAASWENGHPYAVYQYWLLKGAHKDGDRFNFSTDPNSHLCVYGTATHQSVRIENVCRIGNLTVSATKSPFAKIFEGTSSPCKDKYTVVNLSGVGSGIGSDKDNWMFQTAVGNTLDTSMESSGTKYVLKNRPISFKGNGCMLAMPLYHKDIDPDYGAGLTLIPDPTWTPANSGPGTWSLDLGYDIPVSQGGTLVQGGLIKNTPVQNLAVYLWGHDKRAYLKPGQNLCVDSHNGKYRSWLPVPDGWSRTTDVDGKFDWPGDGADGVGRVQVQPYEQSLFPAAKNGYDQGLSLWNGKRLFRYKANRIKGGACRKKDWDHGVYVTLPIGGINFPTEMPWVAPKVKGMPDGMFDSTSKIESVSEVSARTGDVAISATDHASHGITKWKIADVYPYPILVRCAGRGDAKAAMLLEKFFGKKVPEMAAVPADITSFPNDRVSYGALARLRHKESGKYLAISKYALPSDPNGLYVTCVSDRSEADWWMVAPGKNLAARAGGVALTGGEGISLVERDSKKVLCAVDVLPPLSLNYAAASDSEISPAMLGKYNTTVAAYGRSQIPASTTINSPINWLVDAPAGAGSASGGIMLQNQGVNGFLSSVNGYQFQPVAGGDWIQEVTAFDSGSQTPDVDTGDFGIWMLDDFVPAPSTAEDMANAGFSGPLTTFDGKVLALTQVAMGTDGCVYGVDGSQNAVKFDLFKKTQEQIATGVKQVAIGVDDALIMLKNDGTIVLRPSGGADTVVPGCLGRSVAIGSATSFGACSVDGSGRLGHLMLNEANQLLARDANGSAIDVTDDGYVFGIKPAITLPTTGAQPRAASVAKSALALWKKSSSLPWNTMSLESLDEEIVRVSAGSTRFIALRGNHGGLFVLNPTLGSEIFSNPDVLLTDTGLLGVSAWQKVTIEGTASGTPIIVADAAISSNGDLALLAGQINENFEFPVFLKSFAPWPQEANVFNLKVEKTKGVAASPRVAATAARYATLITDETYGYLKESRLASGAQISTAAQGSMAQFSMPSLDGYVTVQTKSGLAVKNSNAAIGLNKDDALQNKNLMTGKTSSGAIVTKGTKLDETMLDAGCAVGFGGDKFRSSNPGESVLEKFMFYAEEPDPDGALRFKLQSKATGGFLKLDTNKNMVVSVTADNGTAVPVPRSAASVFVVSSVNNTSLKLQQSLVGKNALEAMTAIEAAFVDQNSYARGVESFFQNVLRWLEGIRISPTGWIDFSETKGDWTDPVDKLKKSRTASERLAYLLSDSSILGNATLASIFGNTERTGLRSLVVTGDAAKESDLLLKTLRDNCNSTNAPSNLGLLKNVKDGSIVALRSVFGIDADGKLTTNKAQFISELYVAVDPQRNTIALARTTSIDPAVQFSMKVVPSPLASSENVDAGHNSSNIQRWMFQAAPGNEASIKRILAPSLTAGTIDSQASALKKIVLRFEPLADTAPATSLPAYFDVDSVGERLSSQITIQSSSNGGYWAVGISDTDAAANAGTVIKSGVTVIDGATGDLKAGSVLDLDIRTQEVVKDGDGTYTTQPVVGAPDFAKYGPAVFEIVVITPLISTLTAAFKKKSFDEQVADFLVVSKELGAVSDAVTFCEAITSFIKESVRNSQDHWNAFVGNRSARDKLAQCVTSLKQLFADDYGASQSSTRLFIDNLAKAIDIARVPSFGVTKSRSDIIVDLQAQIKQLGTPGGLDKFVSSGASTTFITALQRGVNDWFTSAGIAVSEPLVQADGVTLATIVADYRRAIGTSLSKADRDALDGMSLTLTNSTTMSNPVDILQSIVTANTVNDVITFGSDAKYSFLSKLWELYKSSTLDPDASAGPVKIIEDGKIVSRGDVFGLTPAQLTQLSNVLISVSKAPSSASAPGGPFFGDDAKGDVRGGVGGDAWGWKDQPFGDISNTQIINQLAVLFTPPSFSAFVTTYLQYLAASQDQLTTLATSTEDKDQAQVQRFVLRVITLAEQWNTWQKGATPRLQRQELNQFKSLIRSVKSFVRSNASLKQRTEKLLTVVQSAIDQLV